MPELPEVETTKNGISPFAIGNKIKKVIVRQSKLRWPVDQNLLNALKNKTINNCTRRGKYLQLETESGAILIHLGMSGSLRIVENEKAEKHDHVDINLSNGKSIRYNDPRRFGCVLVNHQGNEHPLLVKLGVEPLSDDFDDDFLFRNSRKRSMPVKSFIMNGHIVVGVGNIYAQEALFSSGIHPNRPASKISKKRYSLLTNNIRQVLNDAIKAGGSSLKDFTGADGKPGYFQQTLNVYGRKDEPCFLCERKLKQITIGQRSTVFCSKCQT
ncbi:MAG: bifunctional DNA-formamidopyrimidine glycosylase/DNA-(apurinic or apyrimidinic site) lyase [Kangiellaceae bacterium]